MATKKAKMQNLDCGRIGLRLIDHCRDHYPPVEGAKGLLMASVSMAKSIGVSRKLFLATAKKMFDALDEAIDTIVEA